MPLKLYGQELQAESYAVAHMNAVIHDMDVGIERGDTMINPKFKTATGRIAAHDVVVANPMWNQDINPDIYANDPFDRFRATGGVTTGKADWAWLQHTLACLNERGRAAVVLDTGAVTRGSGAKHEDRERNIRKWFVDRDLIDGVILLPDNLFYKHQRRRGDRGAVETQARSMQGPHRAAQRQPPGAQGAAPRISSRRRISG